MPQIIKITDHEVTINHSDLVFRKSLGLGEKRGQGDVMGAFSQSRHEFVSKHVSKYEKGIEIGPSYRPTFPKKDDWNIFIVDTMDKQDLINIKMMRI